MKTADRTIAESRNNGIFFDRNNLMDGQTVEIEFEICSKICPNVCSKGKISLILKATVPEDSLIVPKLFSLNGQTTASLEINGLNFVLENELIIVDRWGTPVFGPVEYKNNTPNKSWDGTRNGQPLPTGAYYYLLKYRKNVVKTQKGIIYLIEEK